MNNLLIPHKFFEDIKVNLKAQLTQASPLQRQLIVLTGSSRSGKRGVIDVALEEMGIPKEPQLLGPISRIIVEMPTRPTVKAITDKVLNALRCSLVSPNRVQAENQLLAAIRRQACHVIVLTQFQRCLERGSHTQTSEIPDFLQSIASQTGVVFLLTGLSSTLSLIHSNAQFMGRCQKPLYLPLYDWSFQDHIRYFNDAVHSAKAYFENKNYRFVISDEAFTRGMYAAFAGRVPPVLTLLFSLTHALEEKKVITQADFLNFYRRHCVHLADDILPFSDAGCEDDDLIALHQRTLEAEGELQALMKMRAA